jgi:hypothetical protein
VLVLTRVALLVTTVHLVPVPKRHVQWELTALLILPCTLIVQLVSITLVLLSLLVLAARVGNIKFPPAKPLAHPVLPVTTVQLDHQLTLLAQPVHTLPLPHHHVRIVLLANTSQPLPKLVAPLVLLVSTQLLGLLLAPVALLVSTRQAPVPQAVPIALLVTIVQPLVCPYILHVLLDNMLHLLAL